jgi:Nif-specific regulatory protein
VQNRRGSLRDRRWRGRFFLDEIGDLPLKLQAKLLRVIQQRSFEKVGSNDSISVDVRILAATNKDIEALVERGEFRSDLYYRLNVLPIYIPPLRQRAEDIPELAQFFLKKFRRETKKQFDGFADDAMEAILSYSWPGNVRELENAIERACVIGKERLIRSDDLLLDSKSNVSASSFTGRNLKTALTVFKKHIIQKALEEKTGIRPRQRSLWISNDVPVSAHQGTRNRQSEGVMHHGQRN